MAGSTLCEPSTTSNAIAELALRVVGSEHDGRIVRLQAAKCTIGSAAGCTLRLKAPGVRDVECLVVRGPSGLVVRNWSASTRLNGRRFDDAPLAFGDRLTLVLVELEVLDPHADSGAANPRMATAPIATDDRRLAVLEQKSQEALRVREELARRLTEREQCISDLSQQLTTAQELIAELEEASSQAPARPSPPTEPLVNIEALRQQSEEYARQLAAARQQAAAERAEWEAERAKLQALIAEEESRVAAVSQAVEQTRDEARRQCLAWEAERAQLTADIAANQTKSASGVEKHREAREFEVAITHWRERSEEQQRLIEELQARLEQLPAAPHAEHPEDYTQLRSELEAGARELDDEAERLLERQQTLEQLAKELASDQEQVAAQRAELAAERREYLAEREHLAAERSQWLSERTACETEQTRLLSDRAALEAERANLLAEREALAQEVAACDATLTRSVSADALPTRSVSEDPPPAPSINDETPDESSETSAAPAPYEPPSASDIIARLSASGMWKDDAAQHEPAEEATAPEPAWKTLVPAAELVPHPKPTPVVEEEDSIESYMKRLLQRVSGDSESAPRSLPAAVAAPSPSFETSAASPRPAPAPAVEAEAFDPKTYVPRSAAPELNANLAAMRELANSTVRGAIDSSSKRQQLRQAATKLGLSMVAVLTNFALWWLALRSESLTPFFASITASICSGAWFISAATRWIQARKQQRMPRDTSDDE